MEAALFFLFTFAVLLILGFGHHPRNPDDPA